MRLVIPVLALVLAAGCARPLRLKPAPPPGEEFTLAVLPDTQFYAKDHPEIFDAQTAWLARNAAERRIVFVLHEGDITCGSSELGGTAFRMVLPLESEPAEEPALAQAEESA